MKQMISRILLQLDDAIDYCIENRRLVAMIAAPGTLLFLLLFLLFTGAGGPVFVMGVLLGLAEGGLAFGLGVLYFRYEHDKKEDRLDVADAIEGFVTGTNVMSEWEEFLAKPSRDPDLEKIRDHCVRLPKEYPPQHPGSYCGLEGFDVLLGYVMSLRAGIATKLFEEIRQWWESRRQRAAEVQEKDRLFVDADEQDGRVPQRKRLRVSLFTRKKRKLQQVAGEGPTAIEEYPPADDEDQSWPALRSAPAPGPAPEPQRPRGMPTPTTGVESDPHLLEPETAVVETEIDRPAAQPQQRSRVAAQLTAVEPEAKAKKRSGRMTEATALEVLLHKGLTAHDYDRKQHEMCLDGRRQPSPGAIVRALLKEKKAPKKMMRTPRFAEMRVRTIRSHRAGARLRRAQMVLVVAGIIALPFIAYRVPGGDPVIIQGEVREEVIATASNPLSILRSQFEALYGNRVVSIVHGPRLYLSEADYDRCWPQAIDVLRRGFTVQVTAEAQPLLFGGYGVARLKKIERIVNPVVVAE